jgi:hypothetical protein
MCRPDVSIEKAYCSITLILSNEKRKVKTVVARDATFFLTLQYFCLVFGLLSFTQDRNSVHLSRVLLRCIFFLRVLLGMWIS